MYGYRIFWLNVTQSYFVFHVRACRDAHIVMSSRYGLVDSDTYEVVIGAGDNQQTLIRDERLGWTMSQQYTPEVLSCEQKRAFWVAFDGGRIRVGEHGILLNFPVRCKRMNCLICSDGTPYATCVALNVSMERGNGKFNRTNTDAEEKVKVFWWLLLDMGDTSVAEQSS